MKIKLLSILLVLAFIMSLSSCAVTNDTTDTETTETEDTEFYGNIIIDPPLWYFSAFNASYTIAKITEITEDTENINEDIYYQRFICRRIGSINKNFPDEGSLFIAEDPEQKLKPGDYLFFQAEETLGCSPKKWYAKIGSRPMSEYKVFTDGTIELTDDDLHNNFQNVFSQISLFNEHASEKREWSQRDNTAPDYIEPSFPTKELREKVTVEEASDFLNSVQKARDEFSAFLDDPELKNRYAHEIEDWDD